jgi:Flp pilus assembly protein TadG
MFMNYMRKQWRSFSCFLGNCRGGTALAFALGVPALMAAVGVASDYATMTLKRAELQAAADAGALAGAKEMALAQAGPRTAEEVAQSYAKTQLASREENLTILVKVDKASGLVNVRVVEEWTPIFSEYIGADMTPVSASATAKLTGSANICVLTLHASADRAFALDTGASISAPDCGLYSNSTSEKGMKFSGNTKITSNLVCSAGGVDYTPGHVDPEPTTDCPQIADPLAGRPPPSVGACVNVAMPIKVNSMLRPGHYCSGIKIVGKGNVTFEPGDYIVEGGEFLIAGQGAVIGHDVGFYLKGPDAVLKFAGNSVVEFSGRSEGNMAGMVFFEDRDAPLGREHRIATLLTRELTGTIYLPRGRLLIDPKAKVGDQSAYTAIIAYTLELRDGPELMLNADYGASAVPVPAGLNLNRGVALSK